MDLKSDTYKKMYEYYREQQVLPTYGGFRSRADLVRHESHRRRLFTDKLFLPPRLFRDSRLIEFGPDAGENSLVFALWGAGCTLVEPNPKALPVLRQYFRRFKLAAQLASLQESDVQRFAQRKGTLRPYDIIDAEGFIYTVKPDSLWMRLFSRLTADDGFVILFYYEVFGSFLELFQKAVYHCLRRALKVSPLEAAQALFNTKWDLIPHKRTMDSWVMDVLENPFVRLRYFLESKALCREMSQAGFDLYSSWPPYRDGLKMYWFKKEPSANEQLEAQDGFIARSRLSHLFGRKLYLSEIDPRLEGVLWRLLRRTDELIDRFDAKKAAYCSRELEKLVSVLKSGKVCADKTDIVQTLRMIRSIRRICGLLADNNMDELVRFCNRDEEFLASWGMPSHFAVFRKRRAGQAGV